MKSKYTKPTPIYKPATNRLGLVGQGISGRLSDADIRRITILPQAQSIISKFGGPGALARTLKECSDDPKDHYNRTTIYRWMYPRDKGGTGGEVPTAALKSILKCARLAGVMLSSEDIYPHLVSFPPIEDTSADQGDGSA
jgi:hypothetical protein